MSKSFKTYFEGANYYNDTLHPKFWDDFTFREDILKPILKIVDNFVKDDQHISPEMVEDIFMNLMWLPVYLVYLIIDGLKNLNKKYRR